jgi:hypothetical protein
VPTVRAVRSTIVYDQANDSMRVVKLGEPFDPSDALVAQFPDLFESDVERATANPGEKRAARRP